VSSKPAEDNLVPIGAKFVFFPKRRRRSLARRFVDILAVSAAAVLGFRSSPWIESTICSTHSGMTCM
jgi:hypothetical protein